MPDHEPPPMPTPMPAPPLPPTFEAPESTIVRIAQYMAQSKKATKRLQVTPDEALDRLLAEHDRKAAKKKKQVTPDQAMDMLLAEHDRKAGKEPRRRLAVGHLPFKTKRRWKHSLLVPLYPRKQKLSNSLTQNQARRQNRRQLVRQGRKDAKSTQHDDEDVRQPARRQKNMVEINGSTSVKSR